MKIIRFGYLCLFCSNLMGPRTFTFSASLRMERKPTYVALAGSPEGDGYYGLLGQVALAALRVLWLHSQVALAKVSYQCTV